MLPLMDLLDRAEALSGDADRADLLERLRHARRRLHDPHVRVLVVGELKQGKSQLVNALVNAPVCPVDDDVATSVTDGRRLVGGTDRGAHRSAPVRGRHAGRGSGAPAQDDDPASTRTRGASRSAGHRTARAVDCSEVGLPRHVLAGGLVLVDTPGVGGIGSAEGAATMAALPSADAVLLVSDAGQEYSAPEIEFLQQALAVCPNVACVLTKTDLYPHWRAVATSTVATCSGPASARRSSPSPRPSGCSPRGARTATCTTSRASPSWSATCATRSSTTRACSPGARSPTTC